MMRAARKLPNAQLTDMAPRTAPPAIAEYPIAPWT